MATARFGSGDGGGPVPLDGVAADMRAIFGDRVVPRVAGRARVRSALTPPVRRRSPWPRLGAVLLAGSGAGALLGWWVLAMPPQPIVHPALTRPASVRSTAAPVLAPVTASVVDDPQPAAVNVPSARSTLVPAPAVTAEKVADEEVAGEAPPAAYAAVPAPRAPAATVARSALPAYAPAVRSIAPGRGDDGCARYAEACTGADVRDAEFQFRVAYAAAADAGADPRALAQVRRHWARLQEEDAGRPDLLVTDYARLSGRLGWLAGDAADDGRE